MDTMMKLTKQGIRDLNSYGPRPKVVAPEAVAVAEAQAGVDAAAPAGAEPKMVADGVVAALADGVAP